MRPKHYVHMGPKSAEKVSRVWRDAHLLVFTLILLISAVGVAAVYNIVDMYKFNCILYANCVFERNFMDRVRDGRETSTSFLNDTDNVKLRGNLTHPDEGNKALNIPNKNKTLNGRDGIGKKTLENITKDDQILDEKNKTEGNKGHRAKRFMLYMVKTFPKRPRRDLKTTKKVVIDLRARKRTQDPQLAAWSAHAARGFDDAAYRHYLNNINTTGFLNLRKTVFGTVYMCNLLLFTPLVSAILAFFLGSLLMVSGKGGAGNPGDLLPHPWICVYPFLTLCAFMMVFCFISNNIYQKGFEAFCTAYYNITRIRGCSSKMNRFNIQFTKDAQGPELDFYLMYQLGSFSSISIAVLWLSQMVLYIMRILRLADFSLYVTTVRLSDKDAEAEKMAGVVLEVMDKKTKTV